MSAVRIVPLSLFLALSALSAKPASAADDNCVNGGCHSKYGQAPFTHDAMDNCVDCHKLLPGRSQPQHNAKAKQASTGKDFTVAKEIPDLCWDCHDNVADRDRAVGVAGRARYGFGSHPGEVGGPRSVRFDLLLQHHVDDWEQLPIRAVARLSGR